MTSGWIAEVRYGVRMLWKRPGVTAAAIVTLALGIGANTAIFSVVEAVLLRPLPYPDPGRLVLMDERDLSQPLSVSWRNFLDWREQSSSFSGLAAVRLSAMSVTGAGTPRRVAGGRVSAELFPLLGASPALGRFFGPEEDAPGASCAVVLAHGFWTESFGADPAVVGRTVSLDSVPCTVVGVTAPGFRYFRQRTELYLPIGQMGGHPAWLERGNHQGLSVVGRLRPDVDLHEAAAEMDTIARRLEAEYPGTNSGVRVSVTPLLESQVAEIRPTLLMLLGAVGLVLLMTCANVANLLLSVAPTREREIAVRAALGAGRGRLARLLLIESSVLACCGGAAGLLLSLWGIEPLLRIAPASIPRLDAIRINVAVLGFTLLVSILTGLLFGLAPTLQAVRSGLAGALKEGERGMTNLGRRRLQSFLLVGEVALALVVVLGAGLMIRSILQVRGVDPGFEPERLVSLGVMIPESRYGTPETRRAFFDQLFERLDTLPGVASAGALCLPLGGNCWGSVYLVEGLPVPAQAEIPTAAFNLVTPGYFQVMGIRMTQGRPFSRSDGPDGPRVVIINEAMARRHWPGESPIGRRIKQGFPQSETPYREIVGVVADTPRVSLEQSPEPEVFLPWAQEADTFLNLVLRSPADPARLEEQVRAEVLRLDPDQPVSEAQSMTDVLGESMARRRFATQLLAMFAGLALTLACVGTYGVISCGVAQRTHEIGIRMALGAQARDVLRLVLRGGLALIIAGLAIGAAAALGLARLIASLLFRTSAVDPVTFGAVAALLAIVALGACWLPARRAARVDPMIALRHE